MHDHVSVRVVDYLSPKDRVALVSLLDMYARDPMGGGKPLAVDVQARLCDDLAGLAGAVSFIAWLDNRPIGLLNAMRAYSTFKARPLMNVHDIAVAPDCRGKGVGRALLAALEQHAVQSGCCKLTLEVLSGNCLALQAYTGFGFEHYALDPEAGQALFMQKWL